MEPKVTMNMQERMQRLLKELVDIDSATPNAFGVNLAQGIVARELLRLGFSTRFLANPDQAVASGDLLIAELSGERAEFITLVSHTDTVLSLKFTDRFRVDSQGHALGSGVIDNKGGLVIALEALQIYVEKCLTENRRPAYSLRVVSSPNEEGGSLGFHEEFKKCAADSVLVLGFEPALENGSIVESRRGNRWYQIHVSGQEAHAGRCKGEQINAAHEIAMKIVALAALNDPENGCAVNVAQIEAGRERFNIVCGEAHAKLDVRFASFQSRERLHSEIDRILKTSFVSSPLTGKASTCTYEIVDDCPPFSNTPESKPIIDFLLNKIQALEGRKVGSEKAGGAGDVNYMSRAGVVVIDGLGPVGSGMHTVTEQIDLASLTTRAKAVAALFENAPKLLERSTPV